MRHGGASRPWAEEIASTSSPVFLSEVYPRGSSLTPEGVAACGAEALGQGCLGAGVEEALAIQAGDVENSAHRRRGFADDEAPFPLGQRLASMEDRRDPGGVDEVAAAEADEDFETLLDGGVEMASQLTDDGEVELTLHPQLPARGVEIHGLDSEWAHLWHRRGPAGVQRSESVVVMLGC